MSRTYPGVNVLCVFDVNETLLDLAPLDVPFTAMTGTADARREWFDLVIHTALTVTAAGGYRDFAEIAGDCVTAVLERRGRKATDQDRMAIGATLRSLPAHADVPNALARLRDAGFTLVALVNSPLATVKQQLDNSGLADMFDRVTSAEQVGALKPASAAYRYVLDACGAQPEEAIMVAAHDWDIAGAAAVGMQTAFVSRPGHHPLPGASQATVSAPDLEQLADQLLRTSSRL